MCPYYVVFVVWCIVVVFLCCSKIICSQKRIFQVVHENDVKRWKWCFRSWWIWWSNGGPEKIQNQVNWSLEKQKITHPEKKKEQKIFFFFCLFGTSFSVRIKGLISPLFKATCRLPFPFTLWTKKACDGNSMTWPCYTFAFYMHTHTLTTFWSRRNLYFSFAAHL